MNTEQPNEELVQHLVELALTDPRQLPVAIMSMYQQHMAVFIMEKLTEKLHACMDDFEREALKVFDDMDNTSDIDHEGGPK